MYVGLDIHKRVCRGTIMNEEGKVVKHGKFSNDPRSLDEFMVDVDEATVVMEAGYCWQPVCEWLEQGGYRVKMTHPLKTKAIAEAKVKTDRIDSEVLAQDTTRHYCWWLRSVMWIGFRTQRRCVLMLDWFLLSVGVVVRRCMGLLLRR